MRTPILIFLLSMPASSTILNAKVVSPNYDAVEMTYSNADFDNFSNADIFGPQFNISHSISENFFLEGNHQSLSGNVLNTKFETQNSSLMMGYHSDINETSDLYIGLSYHYEESRLSDDIDARSSNIDGFGLTLGAQGFIDEGVLVDTRLQYIDTGTSSDIIGTIGLQYFINKKIAFVSEYSKGGNATRYHVGIRYHFSDW